MRPPEGGPPRPCPSSSRRWGGGGRVGLGEGPTGHFHDRGPAKRPTGPPGSRSSTLPRPNGPAPDPVSPWEGGAPGARGGFWGQPLPPLPLPRRPSGPPAPPRPRRARRGGRRGEGGRGGGRRRGRPPDRRVPPSPPPLPPGAPSQTAMDPGFHRREAAAAPGGGRGRGGRRARGTGRGSGHGGGGGGREGGGAPARRRTPCSLPGCALVPPGAAATTAPLSVFFFLGLAIRPPWASTRDGADHRSYWGMGAVSPGYPSYYPRAGPSPAPIRPRDAPGPPPQAPGPGPIAALFGVGPSFFFFFWRNFRGGIFWGGRVGLGSEWMRLSQKKRKPERFPPR